MTDHLIISSKATPFPWAAVVIASSTGKANLVFDDNITTPTLQSGDSKITGEESIILSLANSGRVSDDSSKVRVVLNIGLFLSLTKVQSQHYFVLAQNLAKGTGLSEITNILNELDDHLAYRTFFAGHSIKAVDWIVWGTIKGERIISYLSYMRINI